MVDIIVDDGIPTTELPDEDMIRKAAAAACREAGIGDSVSFCLRFSDDGVMRELNRRWRGEDRSTDVLSFPMQEHPDVKSGEPLGDIIIAWPYAGRAAALLGVGVREHALHLIIHGILHLLGHDHAQPGEAARMQAMERAAMASLGMHDPYAGNAACSHA